jgi:hypothetical protein
MEVDMREFGKMDRNMELESYTNGKVSAPRPGMMAS